MAYDQQQRPKKESTGKKIWNKGWAVTGKYLGEPANKLVGKWGIESFWPTDTERELDKAARILRVFTLDGGVATTQNVPDVSGHKKEQKVIQRIPAEVLRRARGLAIFTVFRTGLHWSAASGSGILISRVPQGKIGEETLEPGSWSAPSGILIHTLGVGLMVGIDVYDVVLVLNTEKAVAAFSHPRVRLGAELSVAAGPVGDGRAIDADRAMSWSYTKSKGFFAGVQLDGTVIIERNDENMRFYGHPWKAEDITSGRVLRPQAAEGLYQTLAAAEGKQTRTEMIPQGMGPSEQHQSLPQELMQGDGSQQSQLEAPHGYQDATYDHGYHSQSHPYAQQQTSGYPEQQTGGFAQHPIGGYGQQQNGIIGFPPQQQPGVSDGRVAGAPEYYPPPPPRY